MRTFRTGGPQWAEGIIVEGGRESEVGGIKDHRGFLCLCFECCVYQKSNTDAMALGNVNTSNNRVSSTEEKTSGAIWR